MTNTEYDKRNYFILATDGAERLCWAGAEQGWTNDFEAAAYWPTKTDARTAYRAVHGKVPQSVWCEVVVRAGDVADKTGDETEAEKVVDKEALPAAIVAQDKKLDAEITSKTGELMELRWYWTLNESNLDRVAIAVYARAVDRDRKTISRDANAWVRWLADQGKRAHMGPSAPGTPQTPDDYRQLVKLSDERELIVRAVARANNKKFSNVAVNMRAEVNEALTVAQERAELNGTTVADEIDGVAELLAKTPNGVGKDAALSEAGKAYWAKQKADAAKALPWAWNGVNGKVVRRMVDLLVAEFPRELNDDQWRALLGELNQLAGWSTRRALEIQSPAPTPPATPPTLTPVPDLPPDPKPEPTAVEQEPPSGVDADWPQDLWLWLGDVAANLSQWADYLESAAEKQERDQLRAEYTDALRNVEVQFARVATALDIELGEVAS